MPQAKNNVYPFPGQSTFNLILDEMPLYRCNGFRGGIFSGVAEITYDNLGEWFVSDLHMMVDNARCGSAAESKSIALDGESEPHLYRLLLDRIEEDYSDNIAETIAMERAEAA